MPGNEFGERIHNFFGQEGLSQQDQRQSQVVDGSWSSFSNGVVGNQRQIDSSLNTNLKSYNTQQSVDPERGHTSASQQGLNFIQQQPIRSEYSRNLLQGHQQQTNGYVHGNLVSPNEANFMGVDVESPVNYDFFGGQQRLNNQLPGMLQQPLPRQQMTFNDMQLLKQQVMVKQMHEYQMQQQQFQKQQLNESQSHHLVNGITLQDASSNRWQPDLMTRNANWMHRDVSPVVQGLSSGLMITPEHGQGNLMAQQFEPSLYGMPVGGANAPQNAFASAQMNRLAALHGSANRSASPTNQPTSFINQGDNHMLPRSTDQGNVLFSRKSVSDSNNRPNTGSYDSRERNISVQEKFGQTESPGLLEKSFMKVPENINTLQKSTALDPTEEKFLFGSDDNLWDAFGNNTEISLTGNILSGGSSDLFDACPSLQSGSWSALMQSAVAETSNDHAGVQELGSNQQPLWATHASTHTGNSASNALSERVQSDSTRPVVQHLLDRGNEPMAQRIQRVENIFLSPSHGINGQNSFSEKNEGIDDRVDIWKTASHTNIAIPKEQKNHFTENLQMQREGYGFGIASTGNVHANIQQQHLDPKVKSRDGSQILESHASNTGANNLSMLPGGKETQSGSVGGRSPIPRKFQYHPMGNIDVTDGPCRETLSHFGQSKSLGQPAMNIRIDTGHVSQNDLNRMSSEISPSTSAASGDRSAERCNQVRSASLERNTSQGFNLQLAPPSQPAQSPENMQFSQNTLQPLNTLHTPPVKAATGQSRFAPWATNQSFTQQTTNQGPSNTASGFPYSRGYNQNQLIPVATQHLAANNQAKGRDERNDFDKRVHSAKTPSPLNPTTQNSKIDSGHGFPMPSASQPLVSSSSPQQSSSFGMLPDSRAGVTAPQHRFWNQPSKPHPDILRPHPFPSKNTEVIFPRQEKTNQLSPQDGGDVSLSGRNMVDMHELQSRDMGAKQTSDGSSMFSQMAHNNLQNFGGSIPQNNLPKMTVNILENSAVDPHNLARKGEEQSPSRSDGSVRNGLNQKEPLNQLHFSQNISQSFSNKNHADAANLQQISPQMAPSWYNQYGTFKSGVVQPVNDTGRFTPMKIVEQSSNVRSSVDGTHSIQSPRQQMSGSMPVAETSSTDKLVKVDKPKKRKTATSELVSWNKEIIQGPQRLKTLSEAEVDWARATKRVAEKVEFETFLEDVSTPIKSKRRLIRTTQLMQQLYSSPPGRAISTAASSNYEFVAFATARSALVDACSSTSTDKSDSFPPPNSSNPLSERTRVEKISDQYISKAAEDFISRTQKLETDFAGLESGTTISDLRVEVQDQEKFAVINRFARFHPPSSSMERTVSSVKLIPQRYVSIAPMPENIPDRVQCLSL